MFYSNNLLASSGSVQDDLCGIMIDIIVRQV